METRTHAQKKGDENKKRIPLERNVNAKDVGERWREKRRQRERGEGDMRLFGPRGRGRKDTEKRETGCSSFERIAGDKQETGTGLNKRQLGETGQGQVPKKACCKTPYAKRERRDRQQNAPCCPAKMSSASSILAPTFLSLPLSPIYKGLGSLVYCCSLFSQQYAFFMFMRKVAGLCSSLCMFFLLRLRVFFVSVFCACCRERR
ncbi:MAG: hypothetical protein JOS17DRAFT_398900 [Linnemannia elongata]|nr:MAG: hypothetical protein JOS17DRAFT_398900 [Linnemannia elongata]